MRVLSKILFAFAWIVEAVGGLFFPLLLFFSACFFKTNEGRLLIEIPGFPFVLALLLVTAILMLVGLILFSAKKRKAAYILMITAGALFIVCFILISSLFIDKTGAVSLDYRGNPRLTQAKLIWRHSTALLVPFLAWLSAVCANKAEDKALYKEAIAEIQKKEAEKPARKKT